MIKKLLFLSLFMGLFLSCNDPGVGSPSVKPTCQWQAVDDITYNNLELNHPSNSSDLVHYRNIYLADKIRSLSDIFGSNFEQEKSQIKVTSTANGCSGTTSKSTSFTQSNHAGINSNTISNISTPKNSPNEFDVKVEIQSGLHADFSGGSGYVIWTKTVKANALDSSQSGMFYGTYKKISSGTNGSIIGKPKGILIPMYKDGNYKMETLALI